MKSGKILPPYAPIGIPASLILLFAGTALALVTPEQFQSEGLLRPVLGMSIVMWSALGLCVSLGLPTRYVLGSSSYTPLMSVFACCVAGVLGLLLPTTSIVLVTGLTMLFWLGIFGFMLVRSDPCDSD